jgi:hypothetical protein
MPDYSFEMIEEDRESGSLGSLSFFGMRVIHVFFTFAHFQLRLGVKAPCKKGHK